MGHRKSKIHRSALSRRLSAAAMLPVGVPQPLYGKHCGRGYGDYDASYVDKLDMLCLQHDSDWGTYGQNAADERLRNDLTHEYGLLGSAIFKGYEMVAIPRHRPDSFDLQ